MKTTSLIVGVAGKAGAGKDTVANYLCESYDYTKIALSDPIKRFAYNVFLFTEDQLWGPSENRNGIDDRFHLEVAWNETMSRLENYGSDFLKEIDGIDPGLVLMRLWFLSLKHQYKGKLSPRIMLQSFGTEYGRQAVGEDVWIDYALKNASRLFTEPTAIYSPKDGIVFSVENTPRPRGIVIPDVRFQNEFDRIHAVRGFLAQIIRPDSDSLAAGIGIKNHASETHEFDSSNFDLILDNSNSIVDLYKNIDTYMGLYK